MIPNSSLNVLSAQVSLLPINVCQIEGYFRGTASAMWLQVFDSATTPDNAAVPKYVLPLNTTSQFAETLQVSNMHFSEGVFVGVSTTEGTWTAAAGGNTMDVTVWTDTNVQAGTAVGDKTTAGNTTQVWAQAANANDKLIYGLVVTELLGATPWLLVYADDAMLGVPAVSLKLVANSTNRLYFGLAGFTPRTQIAGTVTTGCTVVVANAYPAVGVAPSVTANAAYILAITN